MKGVYIIQAGNLIKIGRSSLIEKRVTQVSNEKQFYYLEFNNRITSAYFEENLHSTFNDFRKPSSELFDITIEEAVQGLGDCYLEKFSTIEALESLPAFEENLNTFQEYSNYYIQTHGEIFTRLLST